MKKYVKHQAPVLPVSSIKKTLEYYCDILNFDLAWVWEDSYASVYNGDIEIHFRKNETVTPQTIYLFVDNADKVYEFLSKRNVEIVKEPESYPYGMRDFVIKDINGHTFRIGHGEKGIGAIPSFSRTIPKEG